MNIYLVTIENLNRTYSVAAPNIDKALKDITRWMKKNYCGSKKVLSITLATKVDIFYRT